MVQLHAKVWKNGQLHRNMLMDAALYDGMPFRHGQYNIVLYKIMSTMYAARNVLRSIFNSTDEAEVIVDDDQMSHLFTTTHIFRKECSVGALLSNSVTTSFHLKSFNFYKSKYNNIPLIQCSVKPARRCSAFQLCHNIITSEILQLF